MHVQQLTECAQNDDGKETKTSSASANFDDAEAETTNAGDEELTEDQIDAFIMSEQIAATEGNNASIDSKYTPQVGMEFKTRGDAEHFLFFYGFLAGFKPAITHTFRTSNKKRSNEVTKVELKCNKHGKTKKTNQQEQDICIEKKRCEKGPKRNTNVQVKIDCRVFMVIKEHGQKWVIDKLDLEHNHELRPADNNNMFSGHKYMTDMEKGIIRTLNYNNIPTRKMIAILSYLRGGMTTLP
jgi:hypothetical protein